MFDPNESIDFMGFTGPFIQYTYTRIKSIFRKAEADGILISKDIKTESSILSLERELLQLLFRKDAVLKDAETNLSPALIANYAYELAKTYNKFYHDHKVLAEPDAAIRNFRLILSLKTGDIILACMTLLGIELPEKM